MPDGGDSVRHHSYAEFAKELRARRTFSEIEASADVNQEAGYAELAEDPEYLARRRNREAIRAQAWDEGWDAHCPDPSRHRLRKANPYRSGDS